VAPAAAPQTRRQLIQTAAAAAAAAAAGGVAPALAGGDTFNRMSGVLEPFTDVQKGFKLYKPVAWNQFEADPGVYDMKWVDLIEPFETVQVSTSPVSTATSISALGELDEVGAKFAKSRDAQLVSSKSRDADGSLAYTFELKGDAYHEYLLLTINRGKLYRLSTVASNKRWSKREEMYKNVVLSFVPKGF